LFFPILKEEGRKLANTMKAVFLETSAKDNQCASDVFFKSLMQIEKVTDRSDATLFLYLYCLPAVPLPYPLADLEVGSNRLYNSHHVIPVQELIPGTGTVTKTP